MLHILPAQRKLVETLMYEWHDSRVILSNQKSVFTQIVSIFTCRKTGLNAGGKTRNIAFQHILQLHGVFC